MKNINYILILLSFLNLGCSDTTDETERYIAKNNNFFYAIDLNKKQNSIRIYNVQSFDSASETRSSLDKKKNYEYYSDGKIELLGNKIILSELETDISPSQRPRLIQMEFVSGKIIVDCKSLSKSTVGEIDLGICENEKIEFKLVRK